MDEELEKILKRTAWSPTPERIPFPERLVNWYDIAKGAGSVALHFIFDQIRRDPTPNNVVPFERPDDGDAA